MKRFLTGIAVRLTEHTMSAGRKYFGWSEVSERVMEYAFAIKTLGVGGKRRILEVGCTDAHNCLPTLFAALGHEVHGIDIREFKVRYPSFTFSRQDVMSISYPEHSFDNVVAISVVEHMGLKGRYGVSRRESQGDRKAIEEMARVLKPDGRLVITVPYGKTFSVVGSFHRVYDRERLRNYLLSGLVIKNEEYAVRTSDGFWTTTSKDEADSVDTANGFRYALAMFEIAKK